MRFDSIRARAIGPFKSEVSVDLSAIEGKLVAVVGDNGSGKTSLLELLPGACYRTTPTRGSLVDLATARDSFVEVKCVNGAPWTLRHTLDAVSGKSEALVLDGDGSPALPDTKLRSFDDWSAKTLPTEDVLMASTFAHQGGGGFLDMKAGDRKALLLKILGIDRLERLAAMAREHARTSKSEVDVLLARIQEARGQATTVAEAQTALRQAEEALGLRGRDVDEAAARLAVFESEAEAVRALLQAEADRVKALDRTRAHLEAARLRVAEIEGCIANNRGVLARAEEIDVAVVRSADIYSRLTGIANERARLEEVLRGAQRLIEDARARGVGVTARFSSAQGRQRAAEATLSRRDEVSKASARSQEIRDEIAEREGALAEANERIDQLYGQRASTADDRTKSLRDTLYKVGSNAFEEADDRRSSFALAEALRGVGKAAHTSVAAHDEREHLAALTPALLTSTRAARDMIANSLTRLRKTLADVDAVAAMGPAIEAAEAELARAMQDAQEARIGADASLRAHSEASAKAAEGRRALEELTGEHEALTTERTRLAAVTQFADRLANAKGRLAELEPQLAGTMEEAKGLQLEVERLQSTAPTVAPVMPDVAGARSALASAQQSLVRAQAAEEHARHTLARAQDADSRIANLDVQRVVAEEDLADWTRLADDLGKDGLIAAEVDCVGPTLTEMVNDLLHECVGPRWTVTFDTQRLSADGKKTLEALDVRVLDTVAGRDSTAETLSGGEKVLVGEAVSLALSMLACQRSGLEGCTLVRDESGAALDPASARSYIGMLRRACDIIGADKVLLVSHSPEVQGLCDARIEIRDGTVLVAT